jgi:hypothetical protein
MSNSNRPNPSSNRISIFPPARFPVLRMGSRISLEDGSRATIVGTGNVLNGNSGISLFYIVKNDAGSYDLVSFENIDADGRFVK